MHVLIVSAVYPPEPMVSGRTSAGLAAALQEGGHTMSVLAPYPSRPGGRRYPGYPHRLYFREKHPQGYTLIRCLAPVSAESRPLSRLGENLGFGLSSALRLLFMRSRPGVIYANTWPLFAQALLVLVARLRRVPLVLSVQDLYPESLAAQGRLAAHRRTYRLLLALDGWIARSAARVVLIDAFFVPAYAGARGLPVERLAVVPNWVDNARWGSQVDLEKSDRQAQALRAELGVPLGGRLFVYAGNIGAAAGVEALLSAWAAAEPGEEVHLLIAGQGSRLETCRQYAADLRLGGVHFLSPWPPEQTVPVLRAADVLLLPTQGEQSLASLPSKLLDYLSAGRAVLATALPGSAVARVLEESGVGWRVDPGDRLGLVSALRQAGSWDLAELERLGQRGQAYVQLHFSQAIGLETLAAIVEGAAGE